MDNEARWQVDVIHYWQLVHPYDWQIDGHFMWSLFFCVYVPSLVEFYLWNKCANEPLFQYCLYIYILYPPIKFQGSCIEFIYCYLYFLCENIKYNKRFSSTSCIGAIHHNAEECISQSICSQLYCNNLLFPWSSLNFRLYYLGKQMAIFETRKSLVRYSAQCFFHIALNELNIYLLI